MMKLTRTGIGLLTAQYRSVLRKCALINAGLFLALAPSVASAEDWGYLEFSSDTKPGWGTLSDGSYIRYYEWRGPNSSAITIADKSGGSDTQLSIQIDGFFYQNEGRYRLLDTSDTISSVTSGSGKLVTSGAVYSALSSYLTSTTAANTYQTKLSTAQLNAANSGITSSKVSTYDGYATTISNKLDTTTFNNNEVIAAGKTTSVTQNSGKLVTSGAVYSAINALDNNYYRNIKVSRAEKLKKSPLAERSECIQGSTDFFKKFEDALTIATQSRHDGLIFVANDNHATTGNTTMYKKEA